MTKSTRHWTGILATAAGPVLALLAGLGPNEARAQQPAATPAGPGWSGYVPGRGWVTYAPASAPPATSAAAAPRAAAPVAPGWAGYAPSTAWSYYSPPSSTTARPVRTAPRRVLPADGSRRRAANRAVNRIAPELSYTIPAYREYGSGRNIPLAKPWLPASP